MDLLIVLVALLTVALFSLPGFFVFLLTADGILTLVNKIVNVKLIKLMLKNLQRNLLLSSLMYIATFVFVLVIVGMKSIVAFIDLVQTEREHDFKAIITERYQIPSQMPMKYDREIRDALMKENLLANRHDDVMTWGFYGGSIDPEKRTRESIVFFFVMEPEKVLAKRGDTYTSMMVESSDEFSKQDMADILEGIQRMEKNKQGILIGPERLAMLVGKTKLTKQELRALIGHRFKVTSFNYRGIDLECEVVGILPGGRFAQAGVMHRDYLLQAMDDYQRKNGKPHELADKCLNLVWLRFPDKQSFERAAAIVNDTSRFSSPPLKMETAASGVATFLDAYRDLITAMRWVSYFMVVIMTLIFSVGIVIIVNGRRTEFAVMKVLGFQPRSIMLMILGESVLIGVVSGMLSAGLTLVLVNYGQGGIKFPIAFFPSFLIPWDALWWGPLAGGLSSFVGSVIPAWTARRVKAAEVFAKVA